MQRPYLWGTPFWERPLLTWVVTLIIFEIELNFIEKQTPVITKLLHFFLVFFLNIREKFFLFLAIA